MRAPRQTREQREEIISCWFNESPEAAIRLAVSRGLAPIYPYRLVQERGLLPRTYKNWGSLREVGA